MIEFVKDINDEYLKTYGCRTSNSLVIKWCDLTIGIIDYTVKDEYVKIFYITILDEYRRCGLGRQVIEKIINENKGKYLYGDALPGAVPFWTNIGVEFDEDEDDYLIPFHLEC